MCGPDIGSYFPWLALRIYSSWCMQGKKILRTNFPSSRIKLSSRSAKKKGGKVLTWLVRPYGTMSKYSCKKMNYFNWIEWNFNSFSRKGANKRDVRLENESIFRPLSSCHFYDRRRPPFSRLIIHNLLVSFEPFLLSEQFKPRDSSVDLGFFAFPWTGQRRAVLSNVAGSCHV